MPQEMKQQLGVFTRGFSIGARSWSLNVYVQLGTEPVIQMPLPFSVMTTLEWLSGAVKPGHIVHLSVVSEQFETRTRWHNAVIRRRETSPTDRRQFVVSQRVRQRRNLPGSLC